MELGATYLDNLFTNIPTVFPNQVSRSLKLLEESPFHMQIRPPSMACNKAEMLPNYL